jgi:hypothetical protein
MQYVALAGRVLALAQAHPGTISLGLVSDWRIGFAACPFLIPGIAAL